MKKSLLFLDLADPLADLLPLSARVFLLLVLPLPPLTELPPPLVVVLVVGVLLAAPVELSAACLYLRT